MNRRQLFCVALLVFVGNLACVSKVQAQYYFERDVASYVRVDDHYPVGVFGYDEDMDTDYSGSTSGYQPLIASSSTTVSAATFSADLTAFSNTQMTFNPDLVANGQVSGLAISGVAASIGRVGEYVGAYIGSSGSYSRANCDATFTLRNDQPNPAPTVIQLKINIEYLNPADPDFIWSPESHFSIYKNGSGTAMLSSSTVGEVIFIDPSATPGDSYRIQGFINAKGGVNTSHYTGFIIPILGSLQVTGEAEVSVVP